MASFTWLAVDAGCQLGAQLGLVLGLWFSLSMPLCEVTWASWQHGSWIARRYVPEGKGRSCSSFKVQILKLPRVISTHFAGQNRPAQIQRKENSFISWWGVSKITVKGRWGRMCCCSHLWKHTLPQGVAIFAEHVWLLLLYFRNWHSQTHVDLSTNFTLESFKSY